MKMDRTIVFLCVMAIAWTAPVSRNECDSTGDNKDVSVARNASEYDFVKKSSQEYFEHQNARKASGNTSLISERHGGSKSEERGIKKTHANASPVVGVADFVDGNGIQDGKAKANFSSVKIPGSKRTKVANGNGDGRESIRGNMKDGAFSSSPNETGGQNVHDTSQTEPSNDKKCSDGEKAGDRYDDTARSHSNQVQSLTSTNGGVPERRELTEKASLKSMASKIYGESIQWMNMNEGASGHGGDTSEEGSTDDWGDGNSEDTKDLGVDETEKHGTGSQSQAHDGTRTTGPNQGGGGDRGNLDYSLSTSEEASSQQDNNSMSAEEDQTVELCDRAKKNEYMDIQRKESGVLGLKGIGKDKNGRKKDSVAGNHGATNGNLNEKRRTDLPDDWKAIGGLPNTSSSRGASKHRNKHRDSPEDSSDTSNEEESSYPYSFSNESMQGDDPHDSHEPEGPENSGKDEEERSSAGASGEDSVSNDGDSGSQSHSSETEDVSQSASGESKPGSSDTKSDSSGESLSESSEGKSESNSESKSTSSESKPESSEGKSDSSSESKSDSSSESKSDSSSESKSDSSSESKSDSSSESKLDSSKNKSKSSSESKSDSSSESKSDSSKSKSDSSSESKSDSSESKSDSSEGKSESSSESNSGDASETSQSSSRAASREEDSRSSTDSDAGDESKSGASESQSASHSDSGMASTSDESDADGSDGADSTENTSDSESAEDKESDDDSPLRRVDSESESISEGSESNDSTSDY